MEDMIKEIVKIDQQALQKQEDTEKWIKDNEKRLKELYVQMEKEIIQQAKVEAEKKYNAEMEKCRKQVEDIKMKGDQEIELLDNHFNKIHEALSQSLFNEIFELS